jgi:NitT/TauT family transport system substrate-binding protein
LVIDARAILTLLLFLVIAPASMPAAADDLVKLTIGQRGNWDTSISELGSNAGIFKKQGLDLDIAYTSGTDETLAPVLAGAVDIGVAVGTLGAIAAFAKDGPVRIIGAQATGAADYWYAKTTSSIRGIEDTAGKTIAYSTRGSSTDAIVRAFIAELAPKARAVATGTPAKTLGAVMRGEVDVGWASPPFGLREMEDGSTRLVAKASEVAIGRDQTIRVIVANAQALATRPNVFRRFMQGYRDTIDYLYGDSPKVIASYAAFAGIPEPMARRVRDDFFPRALVSPDEINGLDALMKEGVELKFIATALNKEQLAVLIQLQPPITH